MKLPFLQNHEHAISSLAFSQSFKKTNNVVIDLLATAVHSGFKTLYLTFADYLDAPKTAWREKKMLGGNLSFAPKGKHMP